MAFDCTTTFLTTICCPGDLYTTLPDHFVAMPPYTKLKGTARMLLVMLRSELIYPLPCCTLLQLIDLAHGVTDRTLRRAITQLVDGGYLHPLAPEEIPDGYRYL